LFLLDHLSKTSLATISVLFDLALLYKKFRKGKVLEPTRVENYDEYFFERRLS
jgi:hypothetical protein